MIRSGHRRQTSSGAEIFRLWSSLSAGQFWWQVCVEGNQLQSNGCCQLSHDQVTLKLIELATTFTCAGEDTRWWEILNKDLFQMFTIKMTSKKIQVGFFLQFWLIFRFAFIYHLSKDTPLRRTDTVLSGLGVAASINSEPSAPPAPAPSSATTMDEPDLAKQASDLKIKPTKLNKTSKKWAVSTVNI